MSGIIGACAGQHKPVDLFTELSANTPYAKAACPEIKTQIGKSLDLRNAQAFEGPDWEKLEMKKIMTEDDRIKLTLWIPHDTSRFVSYWIISCQYHDMDESVEITLPNTTRYCISMLIKEPPPRTARQLAFWCIPSMIQE